MGFHEYYARVPHTRELIGPYNSREECDREMIAAHAEAIREARADDTYKGSCPACTGSGILSANEAKALEMAVDQFIESGYCNLCEASGTLPPFEETSDNAV